VTDQPHRAVTAQTSPQRALAPTDTAALAPRHIFLPKDFVEDLEAPAAVLPQSWADRVGRPLVYAASAVLAVIGAVAAYALLASPREPQGTHAGGEVVVPLALIDARADTVALALAAFDVRVTMFEERKMGCVDLARGLVQLDETLLAYGVARRQGPTVLDAPRTARDRDLFTGASTAERQYERSGCTRP